MTKGKPKSLGPLSFEPIGYVESCFKEKFGIPRQSGLVNEAEGIIHLRNDPNLRTALKALDSFTHLWLISVFHETGSRNWKPSIRPPRLGGAKKVGVLASRSPHRPNPIGLSVVSLVRVDSEADAGPRIHVRGVDLLDGTPILDIKPYLPYADAIPSASSGWAQEPIARTPVVFTDVAEAAIQQRIESSGRSNLRELIEEMLGLDPRPAFQRRKRPAQAPDAQGDRYGFRLFEYDVKWEIRDGAFVVLDLVDFN